MAAADSLPQTKSSNRQVLRYIQRPRSDRGRVFQQVYVPVGGSVLLSALVAALPPILLAILLAVLRIAPWRAAIAAAVTAFVLAWLVWGMPCHAHAWRR